MGRGSLRRIGWQRKGSRKQKKPLRQHWLLFANYLIFEPHTSVSQRRGSVYKANAKEAPLVGRGRLYFLTPYAPNSFRRIAQTTSAVNGSDVRMLVCHCCTALRCRDGTDSRQPIAATFGGQSTFA